MIVILLLKDIMGQAPIKLKHDARQGAVLENGEHAALIVS